MVHTLFVNYYVDKNPARQAELNHCIMQNLISFDQVVVICTVDEFKALKKHSGNNKKIIEVIDESRPTFSDYFDLMVCFNNNNNLNVIANLDIEILHADLVKAEKYFTTGSECLALCKWDGETFYNHVDSQDVWMFQGEIKPIEKVPYTLGIPGSDNNIAHRLHEAGYNVLSPSLTIKTYHHHLVAERNYIDEKGIVKGPSVLPPYKLLTPTI